MIKKINHVGIAVRNLKDAVARYEKLGLTVGRIETLPDFACKIAFLPCGDTLLELIEPDTPGHPEGLHHICYEVEDIEQAFSVVGAVLPVREAAPKPGADGTTVFFVEPAGLCGVESEFAEVSGKQTHCASEELEVGNG
jgi:methylmalonyl-CoA/ethylmalonyl-CoA epimerase